MNNISAIIVAKDYPRYLEQTINSISSFTYEIIVVDIGIEPALLNKIKKNKRIIVKTINKPVPYVELIREESKLYATGEYIFLLDPDEIVPESLIKTILPIYDEYDYLKIPRKNIIFGKWIKHSRWWPDYQIRLFKKNAVVWPKLIHHQPETNGKGFTLEAKEEYALIHHNYESVDEFMQKALRYAKSEAGELILTKKTFSLQDALQKALSEFISRYFSDEGYKDGMHGFILSLLQMFYYLLVYIYYWELNGHKEEDAKSTQNTIHSFFKNGLYALNHWQNQLNISSYGEKIKRKIVNKLLK